MCLSPILIPNPNRGLKKEGLNVFKDCTSAFISVSCGHCPQCIAYRQSSYIQRMQMEGFCHYLFFGTLTYNSESLPKVTTSQGKKIFYVNWSDFQNMFKRIRRYNLFPRPLKYLAVSEYGGKKHRPHIHFILSVPRYKDDPPYLYLDFQSILYKLFLSQWKRKIGGTRFHPIYRDCCTFVQYWKDGKLRSTYDFHYIEPWLTNSGSDDVSCYVTKYVTKSDSYVNKLQQALKINLPPDEYKEIWSLVRPKLVQSHSIGSPDDEKVIDYLRSCLDRSIKIDNRPAFYSQNDGKQMPLSRYYYKRFVSVNDAYRMYYAADSSYQYIDSVIDQNPETIPNWQLQESLFQQKKHFLNEKYSKEVD